MPLTISQIWKDIDCKPEQAIHAQEQLEAEGLAMWETYDDNTRKSVIAVIGALAAASKSGIGSMLSCSAVNIICNFAIYGMQSFLLLQHRRETESTDG